MGVTILAIYTAQKVFKYPQVVLPLSLIQTGGVLLLSKAFMICLSGLVAVFCCAG